LGRKNFLFCITPLGAEVSGLFYSLVETCKALGLNAEDYLAWLFMNAGLMPLAREKEKDMTESEKAGIDAYNEGVYAQWEKFIPGECDISSIYDYKGLVAKAKPDPDREKPYILRGK
jgi:hypothetical protein